MGIFFLIQNPSFQNYIVNKFTTYLSQELGAEVSIGRIRVTLFQSLLLEDFLVLDRQQDTLLMTQQLKVGLSGGLLDLIDGKINIRSVSINNIKGRFVQYGGAYNNNYQFLLNYIENGHPDSLFSKPSGKQQNVKVTLKHVDINNLNINLVDIGNGKVIKAGVDLIDVDFNEFNLDSNSIGIKNLVIEKPDIRLNNVLLQHHTAQTIINPYEDLEKELKSKRVPKPPLAISVGKMSLEEGSFSFHDFKYPIEYPIRNKVIDFSNIDLTKINLGLENFTVKGDDIGGELSQLALETGTPFNIREFNAAKVTFKPGHIGLSDFLLETDYSHLEDSLALHFKSFKDFGDYVDKVRMTGQFKDSYVGVEDILVFEKSLKDVPILAQNRSRKIALDGNFVGTVNHLQGNEVYINIDNMAVLEGSFALHDVTRINNATLNIKAKSLTTSVTALEKLIPGLKMTPQMRSLGNITFQGYHDGFILDFVTNGQITTALGNGHIDLHMNIRNGASNATYSGWLELQNFDLGAITGQEDLGRFTGTITIEEGKSFLFDQINTHLTSKVAFFEYKGYQYQNFDIDASLNKNNFSGKLRINDPNADLDFEGNLDFSKPTKILRFDADIRNINPDALNLSNIGLKFNGNINSDLQYVNLSEIEGRLNARQLQIIDTTGEQLMIERLDFVASNLGNGEKKYNLTSDLVNMELVGRFQIENLMDDIKAIFHHNHPKIAGQFGIHASNNVVYNHNFNLVVDLKNSKNAFKLFKIPVDSIVNGQLSGNFRNTDSTKYVLNFNASIPKLKTDNFTVNYVFVEGLGNESLTEYFVFANSGNVGTTALNQMDASIELSGDDIHFNVKTPGIEKIARNLNIDGNYTIDNGYNILRFNRSKFDFFDDGWTVNEDNLIKFGNNTLEISQLTFSNDEQHISVNSIGTKGLEVLIEGFDASLLNSLTSDMNVLLRGSGDFKLIANDIFTLEGLVLNGYMDSLFINDITLGALLIEAEAPSINSKVDLNLELGTDAKTLKLNGFYTMPQYKGRDFAANYLDLLLNSNDYPMAIADIFIGDLVENTRGAFTSRIKISGKPNDLSIGGDVNIKNAATTIRYLGTRYYVTNYNTRLTNRLIDLDGMQLLDERGNIAIVNGGIRHDKLQNMTTDIEINSDNFLVLKTTKADNPVYYGTASGKLRCEIKGPFDLLNINIDAVTMPNTTLSMPIASSTEIDELNFIEFIDRFDTTIQKQLDRTIAFKGLALNMNLDLNENATLNLILDEQTGDVIRAQGNGIIEIAIPRNGDLAMYGVFEVANGDYRFTIQRIYNISLFNAPFQFKKGGTITWIGDPIRAQINLDAEYKGLNTSPYGFISEYLPNDDRLYAEASKPTPVDLTLELRGELMQPDISFHIDFPQLYGDIKTYVTSKLRQLEQDPNEMTKQATSLIAFGFFIPKDFNSSVGTAISTTVYNTLSDLVSNQVTQLLTPVLTEAVADGKILTSVSLDFSYQFYEANSTGTGQIQDRVGSELQIGPILKLLGDRLVLKPGVKSGEQSAEPYVAVDLDLEYALTPDRRYIIRLYNNNDAVLEGRRVRSGVGFSYRKSMDSLAELFRREKKKSSPGYR